MSKNEKERCFLTSFSALFLGLEGWKICWKNVKSGAGNFAEKLHLKSTATFTDLAFCVGKKAFSE